MTVHPLILAGQEAANNSAEQYDEYASQEMVEAAIRSLPNGDGLLAGTHAVLPVKGKDMLHEPLAVFMRVFAEHNEHHGAYESAMRAYSAMVKAYVGAG